MFEVLSFISIFAATLSGVEFFRRWSLRRELFDVPNERSSHTQPTPRGGGAIIVAVSLTAYVVYTVFISGTFVWGYLLGAILVAGVSWLDDLYSVSFLWRFSVHALAAVIIILTLGSFGELTVPLLGTYYFGIFGSIVTFLWIVWLTNAYNFMDGIDGIAGLQAVTAGIGWLLIGRLLGFETAGFYGGVLASSSLGFLIHNWQPAKIFMGDVGSAFSGYSFAVIPLLAKNEAGADDANSSYLFFSAAALVWLFVFDTFLTFGRRLFKGEKVWNAHRRHLYQSLVQSGHTHRSVTSLYGIISAIIGLNLYIWLAGKPSSKESWMFPAVIAGSSAGLMIYQYYRRRNPIPAAE
ncbi:MAG: glycosyltransferase family 4 protein [Pyrinomonadaceae bacterium]|nr:glycosyltransferase family 4 protein [Pyrinomonadaceae bacterium]